MLHFENDATLLHSEYNQETSLPVRPARLRRTMEISSMVREYTVRTESLIYPIFVCEEDGDKQAMEAMPGIFRHTLTSLQGHLKEVYESGVRSVLFFGIPNAQYEMASHGMHSQGIVQKAIGLAKYMHPNLIVHADICLCEYTSYGRGGASYGHADDNENLSLLAEMAVTCAAAGADCLVPSEMIDGRIAHIRSALDRAGYSDRMIMSYCAKYASFFFGPFLETAACSHEAGNGGCRMDSANKREALREAGLDTSEGADILIVTPAAGYLDMVAAISEKSLLPVAAFQSCAEYAMIRAAAEAGYIDEKEAVLESLACMKRAGAQILISYFAPQAAKWLREKEEERKLL